MSSKTFQLIASTAHLRLNGALHTLPTEKPRPTIVITPSHLDPPDTANSRRPQTAHIIHQWSPEDH